eukprot:16264_1
MTEQSMAESFLWKLMRWTQESADRNSDKILANILYRLMIWIEHQYFEDHMEDICVWGRKYNTIINGKYEFHGRHKNYSWFVKPVKFDLEFNALHLWHYKHNQSDHAHWWVITPNPPPQLTPMIAHCALESSSLSTHPTLCFKTWHFHDPNTGDPIHDSDIYAKIGDCPQWNCDSITVTGIGDRGIQTFNKRIARNAWENEKMGVYWYFEPNLFQWVYSNSYQFLRIPDPHNTNTDALANILASTNKASWIDIQPGIDLLLKFEQPDHEYHRIKCAMKPFPSYMYEKLTDIVIICVTLLAAAAIWNFVKRCNRICSKQNNNVNHAPNTTIQTKISQLKEQWKICENSVSTEAVKELLDLYHEILPHFQGNDCICDMEHCKDSKCLMLLRNYRNRSDLNINTSFQQMYQSIHNVNDNDEVSIALWQIIDKIHCFLYHSSTEDVDTINSKMMHSKTFQKYNQLYNLSSIGTEFIFGKEFVYVDDEKSPIEYGKDIVKFRKDAAKYSSPKEELISNHIAQILLEQFKSEFSKAKIHYGSHFRKTKYPTVKIEHLLVLMIYCNYDNFQNKFSKTYREHVSDHCNFYHFEK